jgi:hypothetical protein
MKPGIFALTKSEQRVVILIMMALLTAAFIRYWRDTARDKATAILRESHATATPFSSPEDAQLNSEDGMESDERDGHQTSSPQPSP